MLSILAQGSDLFGRLFQFMEIFPAWILLLALLPLLGTLQLALSKHVFWLIPLYLFLCMFSGHSIPQLDSLATLVRWWLIVCFCAANLNINSNPGLICMMLGAYSIFNLVSVLWSPVFLFAFQNAALSILLTCVASRAIAGMISSPEAIKKVLNYYCLMSVVFILNGFIGIGSLSGSRFSGSLDAVSLFVITGGLLMPALLWAVLTKNNSIRIAAAACLLLVSLLCALSGQRTGFFAGIIGCLPLVFQLNAKYLIRGLAGVGCAVVFCLIAIPLFPEQSKFLAERYFITSNKGNLTVSTNTTGRYERWEIAIEKTLERPILGHGARADKKLGFGMHNAYLQEWYNGGIAGFVLFFGASLAALYKTFRLTQLKYLDNEILQCSRLLFSWMIVLFLTSCFESKLSSPSNLLIFTMVLIGVMTHRLELHAKSIQHGQLYSQRI